jgi:hypothetical protein
MSSGNICFHSWQPHVKRCKFFLVEGKLQSEEDVVHIQAKRITQLFSSGLVLSSHDFH